ncbi:MAG TPA: TonB-dependent receptor [Sphingomicrobium sp.]|jgi:outer membrane receptor protein involved in Fe transport|nr:TonB-dependent receptor [Sphingomicrobium sp.]
MKLDFRQRLLATTLLVGAGMVASPAFAATQPATPPTCPPGVAPGTNGCNPPDNSAIPTAPQTIAPQVAAPVPSTNANGAATTGAQEIVVTGSRIPQPNLETASPVTTVTSQEVKLAGTSRTEDLVNSLPQVFASQGSNISNGASGTATVDLRGLGPKRNLVLVDGKRLQAGDTGDPVADINFIPSELIKRVDVLTGGASSVYGADAVAGVVNFIMDTTFTGFRLDGQASVFQHNNSTNASILTANAAKGYLPPSGNTVNGGAQDISGMFGASFDDGRGHVVAYATYRSQDPVLESTRDYSYCTLAATSAAKIAAGANKWGCGGSATSANGTFLQYDPYSYAFVGEFQVKNGNQLVPGSTPFNYAPYNYFQRPDERYNFGTFADYEIAPGAHPYIEAMFMDDHTDAQIAPSGDFGNFATIACDNALLSAQEQSTLCNSGHTFVGPLNGQQNVQQSFTYILRRNVEGGGRDDDVRHTDYRVVAGMRGDPLPGVSYDLYYQTGHTLRQETYFNDFSVTRLGRALDVIDVLNGAQVAPGTPGATLECRATFTGIDSSCVPYNVYQTGGVTQAALDYLETPGFQRGSIDENIAHVDATLVGDQYGLKTPWSDTGVGLNVGAEYRKESLDFNVDQAFSSGDLAGQGGPTPPVSGHFDVREAFAELQVPIIEHNFIDELSLDGGYRVSTYHVAANSFNTSTYKIEARFAPIKDIRFRGSYNHAVRAPNIVELFFPQALGLSGTSDPCAIPVGGGAPPATLAQCQLSGMTAAQYGNVGSNPANQYQGLFGGNPNLQPETADTLTAGVIVQPRFVPGLALTADWFDIKVKNVIGTLGFQSVLFGCLGYGGVPANPSLCQYVHRGPNGSLWLGENSYIVLTNVNQSGLGLWTKGFDFNGSYAHRLGGIGTLNLSFTGTLLRKLWSAVSNEDCTGQFAGVCGTPNPKWRHVARATLTMPNGLGASIRWRYFSPVNANSFAGPAEERFGAQNYFDLTLTARVQQKLNLRLGVDNIFDREPPIGGGNTGAGFGNGNTFPQVYDALGRYIFAGATVDF